MQLRRDLPQQHVFFFFGCTSQLVITTVPADRVEPVDSGANQRPSVFVKHTHQFGPDDAMVKFSDFEAIKLN